MNESESEVIEGAPEWAKGVAALASWSGNYDFPSPYTLFCDLIGFNGEEFGECYFLPDLNTDYPSRHIPVALSELIDTRLGYLEIGMLADALKEYADRPGDVTAYVRRIMEAGREE